MDINDFITRLRTSDVYIKFIYTEGGCYKFAKLLVDMYGGEVMVNKDFNHAVAYIDGKMWDINGEAKNQDDYAHPNDKLLETMKAWSFHRQNMLKLTECPACDEPIVI